MATMAEIAGSLRKGSYNAALLRAAAELAPVGVNLDIASIAGILLLDGDLETEHGSPALIAELEEGIAAAFASEQGRAHARKGCTACMLTIHNGTKLQPASRMSRIWSACSYPCDMGHDGETAMENCGLVIA